MTEDRTRWRSLIGRTTALWAGREGVTVEPGRWLALSGADAVDYNVVLCHGAGSVAPGRKDLLAAGKPGLLMLADVALGEAQSLIEASWVCVDSVPFMWAPLAPGEPAVTLADPAPEGERRKLTGEDLKAVHELLTTVFGIAPELGAVALPDRAIADPEMDIWGAFDADGRIVSCLGCCLAEDSVGLWSLATAPTARRHGHASHLMATALDALAGEGVRLVLFHAAPAASDYYLHLGFREVERWQLWSRPRWVLGRA